MSKLVELLEGSQYARLSALPTPRSTKTFSVRDQSTVGKQQANAVDFFTNTYQTGFNIDKSKLTLTGFKKANTDNNTDYTGDNTSTVGALGTYTRLFNTYGKVGSLVLRYSASDTAKHFITMNSSAKGVELQYTAPTNYK